MSGMSCWERFNKGLLLQECEQVKLECTGFPLEALSHNLSVDLGYFSLIGGQVRVK